MNFNVLFSQHESMVDLRGCLSMASALAVANTNKTINTFEINVFSRLQCFCQLNNVFQFPKFQENTFIFNERTNFPNIKCKGRRTYIHCK